MIKEVSSLFAECALRGCPARADFRVVNEDDGLLVTRYFCRKHVPAAAMAMFHSALRA